MPIEFPHFKLPPPLINPVAHPWMAKIANRGTMMTARFIVPAVAFPLASMVQPNDDTPIISNIAISAVLGAVIGGASGMFFPEMELQSLRRMDAVRKGVVAGAFGAPAVSLAILGAAKYFFKDLIPYGDHVPGSLRGQAGADDAAAGAGTGATAPGATPTSITDTVKDIASGNPGGHGIDLPGVTRPEPTPQAPLTPSPTPANGG